MSTAHRPSAAVRRKQGGPTLYVQRHADHELEQRPTHRPGNHKSHSLRLSFFETAGLSVAVGPQHASGCRSCLFSDMHSSGCQQRDSTTETTNDSLSSRYELQHSIDTRMGNWAATSHRPSHKSPPPSPRPQNASTALSPPGRSLADCQTYRPPNIHSIKCRRIVHFTTASPAFESRGPVRRAAHTARQKRPAPGPPPFTAIHGQGLVCLYG